MLNPVINPVDVDVNAEATPEKKPKKDKIKKIDLYMSFAHLIQRKPMSPQWKPFPYIFHVLKDKSGIHQYLEELENQVLIHIDRQRIVDSLTRYFHDHCLHIQGTDLKPEDFQNSVKYWASITDSLAQEIVPVRSRSNYGYTWHKLPFDPQRGGHPTWDEMLGRMTNSEGFMAWVASLLDAQADRQQYVWLYGEGRNGKGSIARFLTKLLGPAVAWESVPEESNRFWTSGILGKRLVIFDDCERYTFPSSGMCKTLTGGSDVRIERKNMPSFTGRLDCKFLFTSNTNPKLSSTEADMRRAIYCELGRISKQFDRSYEDYLWAEAPHFVYSCWQKYKEMCPDKGEIPVDRTQIEELASDSEEGFMMLWGKLFIGTSVSTDAHVRADKMQMILRQEGLSNIEMNRFKDWMKRVQGVTKLQVRLPNGVREWRYIGLRERMHIERIK